MKRILIWRRIVENNELDIFNSTDYKSLYQNVLEKWEGVCPNWGNKLWFQGLYSEIDGGENEIYFLSTETVAEINDCFDLIIYPMANFFYSKYMKAMVDLAEVFEQIRIPVYIIACGAQASSYNDLEQLVKEIGEPAKRFISAIYNTGGEFALRGNFTKRFFDELGFSSAVVTGCPSMFQMGPEFEINNKKVSKAELNPVINGKICYFEKILQSYFNSPYIDQDYFFECLFKPEYLQNKNMRDLIIYAYKYGLYSAKLLSENRIKMFVDMNDWFNYFKSSNLNYSFGSRIHGSIMAILAGIPATVVGIDTRTIEMADYFNIPYIIPERNHRYDVDELYEYYLAADYDKFNQTYKIKYKKYESFLKEKGIISEINPDNRFFNCDWNERFDSYAKNRETFEEIYRLLNHRKGFISLGVKVLELKNKKDVKSF